MAKTKVAVKPKRSTVRTKARYVHERIVFPDIVMVARWRSTSPSWAVPLKAGRTAKMELPHD